VAGATGTAARLQVGRGRERGPPPMRRSQGRRVGPQRGPTPEFGPRSGPIRRLRPARRL